VDRDRLEDKVVITHLQLLHILVLVAVVEAAAPLAWRPDD
jgi:hypothetical protein